MRNRIRLEDVMIELRALRSDFDASVAGIHRQIDSLHQRIDTVVDALAGLRRDLATQTHD